MLTKEQIIAKMERVKIDQEIELKGQSMLREILVMYEEVGLYAPGDLILKTDPLENNFGLYLKIAGNLFPIYQVPGIEFFWDEAAWTIFKRDVKDVFYGFRQRIREKNLEYKKAQPWWRKLWWRIKGESI